MIVSCFVFVSLFYDIAVLSHSFFISIYYLRRKHILIYSKFKFCVDIENIDDGMVTDKKIQFHSNHKIFKNYARLLYVCGFYYDFLCFGVTTKGSTH